MTGCGGGQGWRCVQLAGKTDSAVAADMRLDGLALELRAQLHWARNILFEHGLATVGFYRRGLWPPPYRVTITKQSFDFSQDASFDIATESAAEVFGLGELALLLVAAGLDRSQDQCLKLSQVMIANGEIDRESVPGMAMSIFQVMLKAVPEIGCQPYVIEFVPSVQGINALPASGILPDDILMPFQRFPGDILQMLADKLCSFLHIMFPSCLLFDQNAMPFSKKLKWLFRLNIR